MFRRWYDEAHARRASTSPTRWSSRRCPQTFAPSARLVLLKGVSEDGFVFYTNTTSRKGAELAGNPRCALLFPWHPLERQVRVDGIATLLPRAAVDAYFAVRPRGSQLGAWASHQSSVVAGRDELAAAYDAAEQRYADGRRTRRPRSGAATSCARRPSSSGRAGPAGCTTGSSTGVRADGWETERLAP